MKISFLYTAIVRCIVLGMTLLLSLLPAVSCKPENESAKRMQEVVAVHDSVMPKMGRIGELVAQLKPLADTTAGGQQYKIAMEDLQAAYQSMMDWMHGFGNRFDYAEIMEGKALNAEKSAWLEEEAVKVKKMADEVNTSIARAEKLLKDTAASE